MKKQEKETAVNLFTKLKDLIAKEDLKDERYTRIMECLNNSTERVTKEDQTPILESRALYQKIYTLCFVDKIKLNKDEASALNEIGDFSRPKGVLGNLNNLGSLSVNMWLGK